MLRLAVGDVTLFTGAGGEFAATLVRSKRDAVCALTRFDPVEREAAFPVTLVQGIAASDAMDHAVRKSVELGVAAIQPLLTARSARVPEGERGGKRLGHWRQIVVSACEQCGRNRVPDVHEVATLERWLGGKPATTSGLVLVPDADASIADVQRPRDALDLLVGPEGGLAPEEIAQALRVGMTAVRLGPRVMRTENGRCGRAGRHPCAVGRFSLMLPKRGRESSVIL